jgi:hypothetical protein
VRPFSWFHTGRDELGFARLLFVYLIFQIRGRDHRKHLTSINSSLRIVFFVFTIFRQLLVRQNAFYCFTVLLISMKASCLVCFLFLGLLALAPAVEILQVPSPDNSNSLMIDKSGRRDVLQLRTGVKVVRLFYDDIDALKPYLARAFGVPATKLGKITLPTYKSAKWDSNARLEIACAGSVNLGDTDREFDFTATVDSSGKLLDASITKAPPPPKPTPKQKATPSKKTKGRGRSD